MRSALSYLFQLRANAAEAVTEADDLLVELKLLPWVLRVAAGPHGSDGREEEETAHVETPSL